MPALLPYAAEIDATRLRAQRALFHQAHVEAVAAQLQRRGATGDAAADDRDIATQSRGHGGLDHGMGIGFTGGWPRRRPAAVMSCRVCAASNSAATRPHMRPWQRPMPTRVIAFIRFISPTLKSRMAALASPTRIDSQRHRIVSAESAETCCAGKGNARS